MFNDSNFSSRSFLKLFICLSYLSFYKVMKKKMYETPAMQVVEWPRQTQLLAGSVDAEVDVTLGEEDWTFSASSMGLPDELLLP